MPKSSWDHWSRITLGRFNYGVVMSCVWLRHVWEFIVLHGPMCWWREPSGAPWQRCLVGHHGNWHLVGHHSNWHLVGHHGNWHLVGHHGNWHLVGHHDNWHIVWHHGNWHLLRHHGYLTKMCLGCWWLHFFLAVILLHVKCVHFSHLIYSWLKRYYFEIIWFHLSDVVSPTFIILMHSSCIGIIAYIIQYDYKIWKEELLMIFCFLF